MASEAICAMAGPRVRRLKDHTMGRVSRRTSKFCTWSVLFGTGFLALLFFAAVGRAETAAQHFQVATRMARQGRLKEAEQEYRRGLALDPNSADAYNNLGVLYFEQQLFGRAAETFSKAYKLRPGDPEFGFNLGLALFKVGNPQQAIKPLQAALHSPKHFTNAEFLLGTCYFELNQWAESIPHLEAAGKKRPDDEKILFLLYNDYRNLGEKVKTLQAATQLLETHPNSSLVYEMLGEAQDASNRPEKAEHDFKKAIAAAPQAPELHFLLGYLYWRWKRYKEAIAPLREETRISPNFAPPYYYLGDIDILQGDPEAALKYFEKALQLDPSYAEASLGMGQAYAKLSQYHKAEPLLQRAVKRMPNDAQAHYWLGQTLIRMGRKQEGQKELEIVNQIHTKSINDALARDRARRESASQPTPPK